MLLSGFALPAFAANKTLYVYDDQSLSRTPQTTNTAGITVNEASTLDWTLSPGFQKAFTLSAGTVNFRIVAARNGSGGGNTARTFFVELLQNGTTSLGTSASTATFTSTTLTAFNLTITVPATSFAAGDTLVLRIHNTSTGGGTRSIAVAQKDATAGASTITNLGTTTVINVDSVNEYSTAYSGTLTQPQYAAGSTVYVRAVISDPFGSYDVDPATGGTAPTVTIKDANNVTQLTATAMTQVADSGADNKTFEYAYSIPGAGVSGTWTPTVVATEGTEGTVTANASGSFVVAGKVVTDLAISKTHSGNFSAGAAASYTLTVTNNGPATVPASDTITVTDSLPATENYVSATGSGWSCSLSSPTVTCTNTSGLASGASLPAITLNVTLTTSATSPVSNTGTVSSTFVTDGTAGNDSSTDNATVTRPNYATSTKTWVDLNGGDVNPGDTVEYTITVTDSGSAVGNNIEVTDNIPADISSYSLVSIPGGSSNNSTGSGTGANGTGFIDISGISVPSGGSVSIVFDAVVSGSAAAGDTITNSGSIVGGTTSPVTVTASTITVSASLVPTTGNKILYFTTGQGLTRTPQGTSATNTSIASTGTTTADWTLTPVLQKNLVLNAGTITMTVSVQRTGNNSNRIASAELRTGSGTSLGTSANFTFNSGGAILSHAFTISLASAATVNSGDTLVVRMHNNTVTNTRPYSVYANPTTGVGASTVSFNTGTVINVDSVNEYSAAYSSTSTPPNGIFEPNLQYTYIRAVVSDPFGSYDIDPASGGTAPTLTLKDPNGTTQLTAVNMTLANDSGAATKTFEYYASGTNGYTVANNATEGFWTPTVTATEGTEGTVTHTASGSFEVRRPSLVVLKLVTVLSDPINSGTNPKSIPGAVEQYSIKVTNTGKGRANAVVITDAIPSNTTYVPGSVAFANGSPTSGLGSPTVSWDNTNCAGAFGAAESTSAKCVKFAWTNTDFMNGKVSGSPNFTLTFNVTVN